MGDEKNKFYSTMIHIDKTYSHKNGTRSKKKWEMLFYGRSLKQENEAKYRCADINN